MKCSSRIKYIEHVKNKKHRKLGVNSDVDHIYLWYILFVDKVMYFFTSTKSFSQSYFISCMNEEEINEILVAEIWPISNEV